MAIKMFTDNAKVMAKGQVTIPKDVREVLGVSSGDRVTFIVEGSNVRIVNSAVLDRLVGMSPKEPVIEKDAMLMDRLPKQ